MCIISNEENIRMKCNFIIIVNEQKLNVKWFFSNKKSAQTIKKKQFLLQ